MRWLDEMIGKNTLFGWYPAVVCGNDGKNERCILCRAQFTVWDGHRTETFWLREVTTKQLSWFVSRTWVEKISITHKKWTWPCMTALSEMSASLRTWATSHPYWLAVGLVTAKSMWRIVWPLLHSKHWLAIPVWKSLISSTMTVIPPVFLIWLTQAA